MLEKGCAAMSNLRSLSPYESKVVLSLVEAGRREFNRTSVIDLLKVSGRSADQVIRSLRDKGWLERPGRGQYLLIPPNQGPEVTGESNLLALASRVIKPYYFAYATAAAYHGLTTQMRNKIWVAITVPGIRNRHIHDSDIRFVRISPRKFFGYSELKVFDYPVQMSDREKTVIDCVDRIDLAGDASEVRHIIATAARRIDWEKLARYLERIGSVSLVQRFGFLAESVNVQMPREVRSRLRRFLRPSSRSVLGPLSKSKDALGYNSEWKLLVNLSARQLGGDVDLKLPTPPGSRKN
jgi:predicted transcriptional regulator of viral defense system